MKIDSAACPVVAMFDFKKLEIVTTGSLATVNVHRSIPNFMVIGQTTPDEL